ncbi:MAG: hypothetical protein ACOYOS_16325, partial [Syntrophales bacterium]
MPAVNDTSLIAMILSPFSKVFPGNSCQVLLLRRLEAAFCIAFFPSCFFSRACYPPSFLPANLRIHPLTLLSDESPKHFSNF